MRIVIAYDKSNQRDYLRQVALSLGLECSAQDCVPYADLGLRLAQAPFDVVLIAAGAEPEQALSLIQQVANYTKTPILAAGPCGDVQIALQTIRAGAKEYLDTANLREELKLSLDKLYQTGAVPSQQGRMVAVTAVLPGTGVTTTAINTAFALAERFPQRVALAEIGTGVPEMALLLDLKPQHTTADLCKLWDRLDSTMLMQVLVPHRDGAYVLAHAPGTLYAEPLPADCLQHTLTLLKAVMPVTILDCGHYLDAGLIRALALCELVLMPVRLDVPSLRLTRKRLKQLVEEQGVPADRIHLLANRYGQRKQIALKQAEETLGRPILETIPDDPGPLNEAVNQGVPLIRAARRAAITRSFDKLMARLEGKPA
jgi:pilus assembly protein CpaE